MAVPNNTPFPPELRTMSIVPRWSIVHVTQRDTVANHSYFVAVYSQMIARVIKWAGPKDFLMFSALLHDIDETVTGDIVGPIKDYVVDPDKMQDYVDGKLFERMQSLMRETTTLADGWTDEVIDQAETIIKAADRLDALLFLLMEERRGNTTIVPLIHTAQARLEGAWRNLPATEGHVNYTWQTMVLPAIDAHRTEGGRGV